MSEYYNEGKSAYDNDNSNPYNCHSEWDKYTEWVKGFSFQKGFTEGMNPEENPYKVGTLEYLAWSDGLLTKAILNSIWDGGDECDGWCEGGCPIHG